MNRFFIFAMLFARNAFIALTTPDLDSARKFWVRKLGCEVVEDRPGEFLLVDAGGVRLCFDLPDGDTHRISDGTDAVIGLHIESVKDLLPELIANSITVVEGPSGVPGRYWLRVLDPDGRSVIFTEGD